jgi:hypothetical protein
LISDLFKIEFEVKLQNADLPDEPPSLQKEFGYKLMCNIDNQGNPINFLEDGI